MGSDNRVVDAARVSFSKEASNYTDEQNAKLIGYLAAHGHFTPFTHATITIRERAPIFVARQRFKHTVGFSYNEVSRRYVDDSPEFYIPDTWRSRPTGSVKQGSGEDVVEYLNYKEFESEYGVGSKLIDISIPIKEEYDYLLEYCLRIYNKMIEDGVAPEQARMVLPQSMYTEYYATGSLYAWARAYRLRIDPHSQKEIQDLAVEWDRVIRSLFPVSWSALVD